LSERKKLSKWNWGEQGPENLPVKPEGKIPGKHPAAVGGTALTKEGKRERVWHLLGEKTPI